MNDNNEMFEVVDIDELRAELEAAGFHTLTDEEEKEMGLDKIDIPSYWQHRFIIDGEADEFILAETWFDKDDKPFGYVELRPSHGNQMSFLVEAFAEASRFSPLFREQFPDGGDRGDIMPVDDDPTVGKQS